MSPLVPRRTAACLTIAGTTFTLAACAGRVTPDAGPQPLVIEAPGTPAYAGTTLTLKAEQARRMSPVNWRATPHERAWVSPDGTLTFLEPGDVAVHATDGWRSGDRDFTVHANPAAQVVMQQRVVASVAVGDTVRILGHVYGEDGARIPEAPVAYALVARGEASPGARVGMDGRFVAAAPGIYTVVAQCGRVSGRTVVIVEDAEERAARELVTMRSLRTTDMAVTPVRDSASADAGARPVHAIAAVRIASTRTTRVAIDDFEAAPYDGTTMTLRAQVWTGAGERDTTARVAWQSSDPQRAWVTQAGQVVFLAPGWVTITASHGGASASRRFNVRWLPAVRLALRPSTADVTVGQPVRFREEVWLPGAIPMVDARVNYAIIAHDAGGAVPATLTERRVFTATQPGVYTVIAEVGGVADRFTLLVRDASVATR